MLCILVGREPAKNIKGQLGSRPAELAILLRPQIFLLPLDSQECTVPPLKDLNHIYLESEVQGCGMLFNWFNIFVPTIVMHDMSFRNIAFHLLFGLKRLKPTSNWSC